MPFISPFHINIRGSEFRLVFAKLMDFVRDESAIEHG
jgi:hypothetical protein